MIRSRGPHIQEQAETRASEFCIPTATRTDQVMGARWSAFKVDAGSVENPAGRTTGGLTRRPGLRSRLNDAPRTAILSSLRRRAQTVSHFVAGVPGHGSRIACNRWFAGYDPPTARRYSDASPARVVKPLSLLFFSRLREECRRHCRPCGGDRIDGRVRGHNRCLLGASNEDGWPFGPTAIEKTRGRISPSGSRQRALPGRQANVS
jgi:hypothetical protein